MVSSTIFGSLMDAGQKMARDFKRTDKRTNPNAVAAKTGKNAKSKKRRDEEALGANDQNQQRMFDLVRDLSQGGATRRTMSGQVEKDVPNGMDFFKNTGADRPEVAARQAKLDSQGLGTPEAWRAGQQAVADYKAGAGWKDWQTPPDQGGMSQADALRTPGRGVDVLFNQPGKVNPRTGLETNDGPFTRSMPQNANNRYGSGSASFPAVPEGDVLVGPMEMQNSPAVMDPMAAMFASPAPIQNTVPQQTSNQPPVGNMSNLWNDLSSLMQIFGGSGRQSNTTIPFNQKM